MNCLLIIWRPLPNEKIFKVFGHRNTERDAMQKCLINIIQVLTCVKKLPELTKRIQQSKSLS